MAMAARLIQHLFASRTLALSESSRVLPSDPNLPQRLVSGPPITLDPHAFLMHSGEPSERAYVIAHGSLVALDHQGAKLHVFAEGDVTGLRSLLYRNEPTPVSLQAGPGGATLLAVTAHAFEECFSDAFVVVAGIARGRVVRAKSSPKTLKLALDLAEFKGIPYATAARFHLPVVIPPSRTLDALDRGPICPQPGLGLFDSISPPPLLQTNPEELIFVRGLAPRLVPMSEEHCLNLNILAPLHKPDHSGYPVLVWVHGGAFESGNGGEEHCDGRLLASRGIVVVSVNYRLGALGFLSGVEGVVPNLGLHDIVAALRWVKANIRRFGGDPNNVTTIGESAGAGAIASLMGTRVRREEKLFHKCIPMSGGASWVLCESDGLKVRDAFLRALGVGQVDVHKLVTLPLQEIVVASGKTSSAGRGRDAARLRASLHGRAMPWQPVVMENSMFRDALFEGVAPLVQIARGMASDVKLFSGVCDTEWTLFMMDGAWKKRFGSAHSTPEAAKASLAVLLESWCVGETRYREVPNLRDQCRRVVEFYAGKVDAAEHPGEHIFERLNSAWMFDVPSQRMLNAHAASAESPIATFGWRLVLRSAMENLKSPHGMDIPLVFGTIDTSLGAVLCQDSAEAQVTSRAMMDAVVQFSRTGNPGFASVGQGHVQIFGPTAVSGNSLKSLFPSEEEAQLWKHFLLNVELSNDYFSPSRL